MSSIATQIRGLQRESLDWIVGHFPVIGLDRRAKGFVSIFEEFIPESAEVLDIGGGWGFYVEPLKHSRGCEVTVLDVVEPKFRKAPVVTYEGGRIPFPDKSFDVSLLITVLHHTASPEEVLAEAKRVARKFVIVVEDLYRGAWGRLWTILRDSFYTFEWIGHPRNFRKKEEWRQCFERLGFELEAEREVYTSLLGIRILNGVFILKA
ncbi:MAG: class I SAM-dependent methyltransferase [Candidatus Omnitrophica bacterium]|nr:class I SAM-dependent methyltransferase [Candidatus Omnitrophota bacterium]